MSKVSINESTLTNIGAAIREMTGKTDLIAPGDMPAEIRAIETGGGDIEVEPIVLTGSCDNACRGKIATNYIKLFGDTISTSDISSAQYMFQDYGLESVPFDLNFKMDSWTTYHNTNLLFCGAKKLKTLPKIINLKLVNTSDMFKDCFRLREIPEDIAVDWNYSYLPTYQYCNLSRMCSGCYSLKAFPEFLNQVVKKSDKVTSSSYVPYNALFSDCYNMREVVGLGVSAATYTSNSFAGCCNNMHMLKKFTFETNEDGTPKTANWKNQTIDLSKYVGYYQYLTNLTHYNAGVDIGKVVANSLDYAKYKDDPDYLADMAAYSRYNHDSAVETINSLPDCSASGGTNTIKFNGECGRATDGGAIDTLTEEEIAVATAKGWTVTLV